MVGVNVRGRIGRSRVDGEAQGCQVLIHPDKALHFGPADIASTSASSQDDDCMGG